MRIWSIGHGTRSVDELITMLREHGITTLVDVRSFPGSRRHPQFGKGALEASLPMAGIGYVHVPELGGRRRGMPASPHRALRVAAFRAYADHMGGAEFRAGYERLRSLAGTGPTAFMCAETLWWRCHRRLLSDRLTVDGWEVMHLRGPGASEPHRLWDTARLEDGHLVYDAGA